MMTPNQALKFTATNSLPTSPVTPPPLPPPPL